MLRRANKVCYEGVDLTQESFYNSLTGGREVSTSQPSPGDVIELWDEILKAGYEEVIYIPMSSGLSNSCEAAIGLSREYEGKVMVVDNHRISVTMRESVLEAKRMAEVFPGSNVYYNPLSFSIGSHTGPGAIGVGICVVRT